MHNNKNYNTAIIAEMILNIWDVLTKRLCKGKITSEAKKYENNRDGGIQWQQKSFPEAQGS